VIGEGLAGPFAGDQDAAPGVAEVLAAVGLAGAAARSQAFARVLGLDAVAQPVGTGRGARLVAQRVGQPSGMRLLGVGGGLVAVGDVLGQVLGEVADAPGRVAASGEHALGVELRAEPGDVQRLVVVADGVECLVPGGQELTGRRVEVAAGCLVPDWQVRVVVLHLARGRPPDLVVGGGEHLAQLGAGNRAADGYVDVRGEPSLWLDGGEVRPRSSPRRGPGW
jgi:hypothetical protein